jgi:lysyl-tRNA synthetase, class II
MQTIDENVREEAGSVELLQVRRDKLDALRQAGRDPYKLVTFNKSHSSRQIIDGYEGLEGKQVSIAGRLISKRIMGKASFANMLDGEGTIQFYVKREDLGEEAYDEFKKTDIGDILGVSGFVFKTRTGEISVHAQTATLLSKSLLPLPEKWHGLKDQDLRYRQRYVDLIVNPEVRQAFRTRSRIMGIIRRELDAKGYLEVETPVLHNHATNSAARPFKTHHNTLDIDMFLRVETELALKRLIVGGLERVYEIGRIFRNEGMDVKHNPEFTSIELYEAYTDYNGMMNICEQLHCVIAQEVLGTYKLNYQSTEIDLTPPWRRLTMTEAVKEYSGVDFSTIETDEQARQAVLSCGIDLGEKAISRGEALNLLFEEKVEENLIQPTFICDYPVEISPLAKRTPYDNRLTERFEAFIYGREMGNAFTELNDPIDQRERFVEQAKIKHGEGEFEIDEDFITAMEYGMPPTGGMGLGIDRMVMLFTDSASIRDVLLFPTMKPRTEQTKGEVEG